jgi:hypothetical protein
VDPFREGVGTHGKKPSKPPLKWKKVEDMEAVAVGLNNKYEMTVLRDYLYENGEYTIKTVTMPYLLLRCNRNIVYMSR